MSPDTRVEPTVAAARPGAHPRPPATSAQQERYHAYRMRQGRDLLNLVPREGLRRVIQACRPGGDKSDVSLDELAAFCADLLPLPPLSEWMIDFQRNRGAHLADEAPSDAGPRSPDGTPVVVAVRHFRYRGRDWVGQLLVWPRDARWEGAIQFHGDDEDRTWRTAPIFRESSVTAIRERFRIFDDPTVAAFLRSALP
ncbi:MAG: hypothetical protein RLN75_04780 [Longimicrobiales bacterium]